MAPVIDGYQLDEPIDAEGSGSRPLGPDRARADPDPPRSPFDPPVTTPPPRRPRVWRGTRVSDGLPVAIKVFPDDQAGLARREAALLAAVEHPHVIALIGVAAGPGHLGLVTELAAGGSLRSLLARRGRLPWREALTVLIPLADALAAADERGMVHGDLSTGNVLFDAAGRPLLADLGAARAAAELSAPVAVTVSDVAPEVARGAAPDHHSDLFSLGSVALQCLSGRPAWPADTVMDVLVQSTAGQWPDPEDVIAPEDLLRMVRRLLDPDPARRGSAAATAVDLRRVGEPLPVDLDARDADGQPRLPATEVRPEMAALRRAELAHSSRRRQRPGGGMSRRPGRGRHAADRPADARRGLARIRGAAVALVVALVLGAGAVWVGLWWARSGRVDPSAVSPMPAATTSSIPGAVVDWTAVVTELDAARAHALIRLDPALLDLVYLPDAVARSQDDATIQRLVASGYRLTAATHLITGVTVLPTQDDPAGRPALAGPTGTAVRVVESMPAAPVTDRTGRTLGRTAVVPAGAVILLLVRTDDGFRIGAVHPG